MFCVMDSSFFFCLQRSTIGTDQSGHPAPVLGEKELNHLSGVHRAEEPTTPVKRPADGTSSAEVCTDSCSD